MSRGGSSLHAKQNGGTIMHLMIFFLLAWEKTFFSWDFLRELPLKKGFLVQSQSSLALLCSLLHTTVGNGYEFIQVRFNPWNPLPGLPACFSTGGKLCPCYTKDLWSNFSVETNCSEQFRPSETASTWCSVCVSGPAWLRQPFSSWSHSSLAKVSQTHIDSNRSMDYDIALLTSLQHRIEYLTPSACSTMSYHLFPHQFR